MPGVYDIDFGSTSNGWAVGSGHIDTQNHIGGKIIATADGGLTWSFQTMPSWLSLLWGVAAGSATNVVAVGDSGTIVSTKDGGKTWVKAAGTSPDTLRGVAHAGGGTFVAVGTSSSKGVLYRSTDGGTTWTRTLRADVSGLRGIAFNGASGVAGGYGKGLRTTDSGASWSLTEDMSNVYDMAYVGPTAWTFGATHWAYGTIFSWSTNQFTDYNTGGGWKSAFPSAVIARASVKPSAAWAVGSTGISAYSGSPVVFTSTSPALSWTAVTTPLVGSATAVYCQDANIVWLAGSSNYVSKVIRSADGGKTWKDVALSVPILKSAVSLYAPAVSPATPVRTKYFKISGSARPAMNGIVSVRVYRKGSTRLYTQKSVRLVNRGGSSTYSFSLKLPAGKWYVRTYFAGDASHKTGLSASRSFTVK